LEAANLSRSSLLDLAGGKVAAVTCEFVNQAHAAGDPIAKATLLETVELLAVYLGNTIDLLEPDVIVVGGGVAGVLQLFFDEVRTRIPGWCINSRCREIPLVSAHYGAHSGIAGGAALAD
jgi:predicted NBD/HSP70 family sugar kinase